MSHYKTRTYEAVPAHTSRDGRQIRIVQRTEDRYRPDETTEIVTLDLDKAEGLHESLGETIERME